VAVKIAFIIAYAVSCDTLNSTHALVGTATL